MSGFALTCALAFGLLSSSTATVRLDADDGVVPLLHQAEYFVDVGGTETIDTIQHREGFSRSTRDEVSRGLVGAVFWVRFTVVAVDNRVVDDTWALRANFPRPIDLQLWTVNDSGTVVAHQHTGLLQPREVRPVEGDAAMMVPLIVPRGTHWVRAFVEPARLSLDVGTDRAFAAVRSGEGLRAGLYYGIFVGLFCFNLLFGLAARDPAHLLYCLFLVCIAMHMGVRDGWLPDDLPKAIFLGAGMTLTSLSSTAFARRFLGVSRTTSPRLATAFSFGLITALLFTIPPLFGVAFATPSMAVTLLNIVIIVSAAVVASARGSRPAQLFLLAWTLLIASVVLSILHAMHIIDAPWTTTTGVRIGAAAEMILLALALAARVGVLREEKERAELALKDATLAQLDAISRTMIEAQEAERVRFARDLHDGLGHSLLLIKQVALKQAPAIADGVQTILDDARAIARSIMPTRLDSAGLAEALRALADGHAEATGADVDVVIDDDTAALALALGTQAVHAFRVAQEALSNASRHGGADHVLITLRTIGRTLVLGIVDNGRGMKETPALVVDGVGLTGMKQRARILGATLTIAARTDGRSGVDVHLAISLPVTPGSAA